MQSDEQSDELKVTGNVGPLPQSSWSETSCRALDVGTVSGERFSFLVRTRIDDSFVVIAVDEADVEECCDEEG